MKDLLPKIKPILIGLGLSAIASIITIGLHSYNIFDTLEYKLYDFKFQLRGPTAGDLSLNPISKKAEEYTDQNSNNIYDLGEPYIDIGNDKWDKGESFVDLNDNGKYDIGEEFTDNGNGFYDSGMNVILVEIDDESYRLIDESYPFPRERVWARAIRNLALAGAKVIFFDIIFDKPDHQSETIIKELGSEIDGFMHGDIALKEAIEFAKTKGTTVILGGKIAIEPTRVPPHYYLKPTPVVMESEPLTAIVGVPTDIDGVHRRYMIFQTMPNDSTWYLTAGAKSALAYLGIEYNQDSFEYSREERHLVITDDDRSLTIKTYGNENTFLINYYGPASGAKASIGENITFKTFNRYPLANIVDNAEYDLTPIMEDTDWMDQFLPGIIPDWILAIEDAGERQMMMDMMGIGSQDDSDSPFKNKIIIIGTALPEDQDLKITPYYSLWGKEYLMPGMEVHANAIQQILDNNYISVMNNSIYHDSNNRGIDIWIISVLSLLTFLVFYFANPVISAIFVVVEIILWIFYSIGGFVNNYLWVLKYFSEEFYIIPPSFNESIVIPVIFPLASIILTYGINLSYKLVTEGQDKAFLKAAFGNYISPELIDEMFDSRQKPQLGGDNGMRTAYFTDIASFSTFSEKLTATRLVELLNEYLTSMTDILLEEGGTLDKYEGDAIIAFFGAPVEQPDNSLRGLRTAVRMQEGCEELRNKWTNEGDKWPEVVKQMRTRIGINHGDLVNGNMGSEGRMNYTMMGDTVNTAARLEEGAKQYGIYTATTYETLDAAGKENFEWRIVDKTRYVGKSEAITTVEILGFKGKISKDLEKCIAIFNEGFELYQNMEWDNAISKFKESAKLEEVFIGRPINPSEKLIGRCEEYKLEPPAKTAKEWDGVFTLTKK